MRGTVERTDILENLPDEMKNLKRWLLWKAVTRYDKEGNPQCDSQGNIKVDKVPYQWNGEYKASKTNPSHFITFLDAMKAYNTGGFSGIGFVLVESDPYTIIDLDDCFKGGQLTDKAKTIVDSVDSYTELSQSGNGLHIVVKSNNIKGFNNHDDHVEMYSQKWFFAMTGNVFQDLTNIEDREEIVSYLHDNYSPKSKEKDLQPVEEQPEVFSDDELVVKIRQSKQGDKFSTLFDKGDISNYASNSEADYGLANILAWWTKNSLQIERIMRNSALYRVKWDKHPDYLQERSVQGALQNNEGKGYKTGEDFQLFVDDLKETLKNRRFDELASLKKEWEENGSTGRPPRTISPIRCSIILTEYISFCLFDLEENTRLAMYLPDEGIYTRNTTRIKRIISWLEPKLNSSKADDVIYHLMNIAEVKEKTESRYLIPVNNGVFNLETKTLETFSPEYVFTSKISIDYVEKPDNPVINGWSIDDWIRSIACKDEEIYHLLWQVMSDSLNGNYSRRKAIFLVGEGNNGKGTFQELITNLIGLENIATLKVNEFDQRFKLGVLEGKTAVIGDDVPVNVYVDDSSNFNSVVTGDRVSIEVKNKQPYNAVFNCSVIQSTNDMPKFRNKTNGTLRRILIVPFKANFDGTVEDMKIKDEYIKNKKVLQYVLYNAINMDFEKFDTPEASEQELEMFKQDNDPVYDFKLSVFDEWNVPKVPKYIVYGFYKSFCNENGYKHLSDRQFHKQFKRYLGNEWETDSQGKFRYDTLKKYIGDLDLMNNIDFTFPDQTKNQKSYENTRLKAM